MGSSKPLWRQVVDGAERRVAPRLESAVQTGPFADALAHSARARRATRREFERRAAQLLHLWNLPAGTDVAKLREQIGRLEHRVRELSAQLEDQADASAEAPEPDIDEEDGA